MLSPKLLHSVKFTWGGREERRKLATRKRWKEDKKEGGKEGEGEGTKGGKPEGSGGGKLMFTEHLQYSRLDIRKRNKKNEKLESLADASH